MRAWRLVTPTTTTKVDYGPAPITKKEYSSCVAKRSMSMARARNSDSIAAIRALPTFSQMTFGGAPRNTLSVTKSSSRVSKMHSPVRAISHTDWSLTPAWPRLRTWVEPGNKSARRGNNRSERFSSRSSRTANLGGRQDQQPALALGRKAEAREYVLMSQLREVSNQFILAAAAGEKAEHLPDRDAGAPYARLPETDRGINGNAV